MRSHANKTEAPDRPFVACDCNLHCHAYEEEGRRVSNVARFETVHTFTLADSLARPPIRVVGGRF